MCQLLGRLVVVLRVFVAFVVGSGDASTLDFMHDVLGRVEFAYSLVGPLARLSGEVMGGVELWFGCRSYAEVCPGGGALAVRDERLLFGDCGRCVVEVGLDGYARYELVGFLLAKRGLALGNEYEVGLAVCDVLLGRGSLKGLCGDRRWDVESPCAMGSVPVSVRG